MENLKLICKYSREGSVSGHWCNMCPPVADYKRIEKAEELAWKERNKPKKKNAQNK
jgi:hypothetical protein